MRPKISVIVPVYNVEKYLHRCIDSILAQTFTDFELLLIDDGSKDQSGKICDEYAVKDKRIRVFHKENGGVSSARQFGVDNSNGEYSIHVDSDDWVDCQMLDVLYFTANKSGRDIVVADYFHNGKYISEKYPQKHIDVVYDLLCGKVRGVMWNKLVRLSLYKKFNVLFPSGINFCEDLFVCVSLCLHTNKIEHINQAFYHYEDNVKSITHQLTKSIVLQRADFIMKMSDVLISNHINTSCLLWQKMDVKWLMFNSPNFTYIDYKSYFREIFKLYRYQLYPHYFKAVVMMFLAQNYFGWILIRKIRNLKP